MYDLQVLAWQADITRVTTFLMAKELSNAAYPKSNVRDAFHALSHHSNVQANKDRFAVLNSLSRGAVRAISSRSSRRRPTATAHCSTTRWCSMAAP